MSGHPEAAVETTISVGPRRRSGALLLVAALFTVTWISAVRGGPLTVVSDAHVALALALLTAAAAALCVFQCLLGFAADGRRVDLMAGLGFGLLSAGFGVLAAGGLLQRAGVLPGSAGAVIAGSWAAASVMFVLAVSSSRWVATTRRRPAAMVSLASIVLLALFVGTWALGSRGGPGGPAASGLAFGGAILCFVAAGILWRGKQQRTAFPYLEYVVCAGGFIGIQYAFHPAAPPAVSLVDLEAFGLVAGAGLAAAASLGATWMRAGRYEQELSAIRTLGASTAEADVATLSKHVARVVGDLIDAQVRVLAADSPQTDTDTPDAPSPSQRAVSRLVVTVERGSDGQISVGVPLSTHGRRLGTLIATRQAGDGFSDAEIGLLEVCGAQASLLLERSVLREEVAAAAVVEERSRLAREVHDGLAQHLAFLKMRVAWLRMSSGTVDAGQLEDVEAVLETALKEARHAITTLRSEPEASSTADAVAGFAAEFGQIYGVSVQVVHDATVPEVGPKARVQLLRIVQEALNNARKHAGASQLKVSVRARGRGVEVSVEDDGAGFDTRRTDAGHFGLAIMRERAESIGGHFELTSSAETGTRIRVWVPALEAPGDSEIRAG